MGPVDIPVPKFVIVALLLVLEPALMVVGLVEQPTIAKSDWAKTLEAKHKDKKNGNMKYSHFFGGLFQDSPGLEIL